MKKPFFLLFWFPDINVNLMLYIAVTLSHSAAPCFSFSPPSCSNEREGIPANLLQMFDVCVEIPQQGVIRSLNVHVSAALLIWEYTRQHLPSGSTEANSERSWRRHQQRSPTLPAWHLTSQMLTSPAPLRQQAWKAPSGDLRCPFFPGFKRGQQPSALFSCLLMRLMNRDWLWLLHLNIPPGTLLY